MVSPLHLEVQSFQNPDHFLTGNIGAQEAVDLRRLQLHGDGVGVLAMTSITPSTTSPAPSSSTSSQAR